MTETSQGVPGVISVISRAASDRQVPLLRSYVELQIDLIEQAELDFYEFMADCVVLGGQRMQDIRMDFIEERLNQLENPAFRLEDMVMDLLLVLVVEIAVVTAPHLAPFALAAGIAMQRTLGQSVRRLGDVVKTFRGALGGPLTRGQVIRRLAHHEQRIADGLREIDLLHRALNARRRAFAAYTPSPAARERAEQLQQRLEAANLRSIEDVRSDIAQRHSEVTRLKMQLLAIDRELADNAPKLKGPLESMVEAAEHQLPVHPTWQKWADDAVATAQGRVGEDLGGAFKDLVQRDDPPSGETVARPVFSTADVLGRYLLDLRAEQGRVRREYGELRNFVRYASDDAFLDNAATRTLVVSGEQALAKMEALALERDGIQPAIVDGIEIALWAYYLNSLGCLRMSPNATKFASGHPRDSKVVDDIIIRSVTQNASEAGFANPTYTIGGTRYVGINVITEYQAQYFYNKFAKHYLRSHPEAAPFEYDPKQGEPRATETFGMDETWFGMTNGTRVARFKEVKALVIGAFRHFLEAIKDRHALGLFGEAGIRVGDVFDPDFVNGAISIDDDKARAERLAEHAETLRQMLASSGFEADRQLELGLLHADGLLVAIEAEIREYESLLSVQVLLDGTLQQRLETSRGAIADLTLELDGLLAYLQELTDDSSDVIDRRLGDRLEVVKSWTPPDQGLQEEGPLRPGGWHFFGPVVNPPSDEDTETSQ